VGFLDKAKEAAKQAQQKLDETQQKFNENQAQRQQQGGPPVEYDKHGRPISQEPAPTPAPFAPAGRPGSTGDAPPTPYVEAPPPAGPPPGHPAARAAATAPVGPRPGVTMPPDGPASDAPVPGDADRDAGAPVSGPGVADSGAGAPPSPSSMGGPPEGGVEDEVIHGAPSAPPGPPPSEPMGPPPTPGQQDPNAPPRMTSGDPLAG